jgi:hypothetical protein
MPFRVRVALSQNVWKALEYLSGQFPNAASLILRTTHDIISDDISAADRAKISTVAVSIERKALGSNLI